MPDNQNSTQSSDKNISISGDVVDSVVIAGDNNQTVIQKFFNIFKSDAETLEQRNRRILLGHVENAWIKGVLDASLHGAALLDLGIKQDPEAMTQYPWAIKKESTKETLPAGTSMLEIFDSIGMGRSLLILGAPGSGKTTMLLELARGLIARAREDVTQPIPMVFNLASWTEKLSLADWLAQELNNLYSVPRKTAPDWVKGNKLLLLLDGLDEVRQESRAKCVDAINEFRKQNGLTSLAVCSRSQDYADLNTKLSFEGAIEVQPLTQSQITEFFNRFGKEMAGIKQALEKDSTLREMAETPLFLSIMVMAYRDKQDADIPVSTGVNIQRKHLFDTYIERMFERRAGNMLFKKQDVFHWLSWLAKNMTTHDSIPYLLEDMQQEWLNLKEHRSYKIIIGVMFGLLTWIMFAIISLPGSSLIYGFTLSSLYGLIVGLAIGITGGYKKIKIANKLIWNIKNGILGTVFTSVIVFASAIFFNQISISRSESTWTLLQIIGGSLGIGLTMGMISSLSMKSISQSIIPGESLSSSVRINILVILSPLIIGGMTSGLFAKSGGGLYYGLGAGVLFAFVLGGHFIVQHFALRFSISLHNLLPWRLVPFLNHCVDLIFLRRVGGGYIFVHRLLMEHFAEMYLETPTSKGN